VVKHKGQKNKPLSGKTQRTEEQTMIFNYRIPVTGDQFDSSLIPSALGMSTVTEYL
jgi:hypothetical protein